MGAVTGARRRHDPLRSTRGFRWLGIAWLAIVGCGGDPTAPAEAIRLIAPARGTLPVTYTLGDETRPVLALPPETRVQLSVPSGSREAFTFPLPGTPAAGDVIATGVYDRWKRVFTLPAQRVSLSADAASATMQLPTAAQGPGPVTQLTLVLTRPPQTGTTEIAATPIDVPRAARLHFAYGLSQAAAVAGAAAVAFDVVAREVPTSEGAPADAREHALWSSQLRVEHPDLARWREVTVDLASIADRRVVLLFRARAAGEGQPVVVPLWADPTVTAPAPRSAQRRNVVLISLDTLRADRLAAYGAYRPTTPAIDAFANESVVFEQAWSPWPETSGSHMSMFTSRYPSEHGVQSFVQAPAASVELLAERLRREGYLTHGFTEDGGVWALAGFARGFSAYSERRSPDLVYRGDAEVTFRNATRFIERNADRTFFLFVHTYQVHAPYSPPQDYARLFEEIPAREPERFAQDALAYDREARYTDDQFVGFLTALRRLKLDERTIVVITSDHGEEFGEHGDIGHGRTLHQEVLRVPMLINAPGLLEPQRIATPASLIDLAPTILDLLGLAPLDGQRGTSLLSASKNGAPAGHADRAIFGEVDRFDRGRKVREVSVRRRGETAILDLEAGSVECFGADDPFERTSSGSCPELVALIAEHRRTATPIGTEAPRAVDPRLVEKMRALGYID